MKIADSKPFLIRKMRRRDLNQVALMQSEMIPGSAFDKVLLSVTNELTNSSYLYLVICNGIAYKNDLHGTETYSRLKMFPKLLKACLGLGFMQKSMWNILRLFGKNHVSNEILGFVGLWFGYNEVHINSIYVKDSIRRTGLGELLQIAAMNVAINSGSDRLTLEVRASNIVAQSLYRKYGLVQEGLRHKYYRDNNEDALIMTNSDIQTSEYENSFKACIRQYELRWETSLIGNRVISLLDI